MLQIRFTFLSSTSRAAESSSALAMFNLQYNQTGCPLQQAAG